MELGSPMWPLIGGLPGALEIATLVGPHLVGGFGTRIGCGADLLGWLTVVVVPLMLWTIV